MDLQIHEYKYSGSVQKYIFGDESLLLEFVYSAIFSFNFVHQQAKRKWKFTYKLSCCSSLMIKGRLKESTHIWLVSKDMEAEDMPEITALTRRHTRLRS